jgi:hypothetical protein
MNPVKPVDEMMLEWAREATAEAFQQFKIRLDWKEESIETLEQILGALHRVITGGYQTPGMPERPSKEDIWLWSTRYGAYLGKLITQYVGGKWEAKPHATVGFGYIIPLGGVNFFPIVKVNDRLMKGEGESVLEYYLKLKELNSSDEG